MVRCYILFDDVRILSWIAAHQRGFQTIRDTVRYSEIRTQPLIRKD
uniref:Uncharacterized protein n=1 Tax=viral metagenome TaxID=1070528 RepID=A0A6C0BMC4_9ZZZZ